MSHSSAFYSSSFFLKTTFLCSRIQWLKVIIWLFLQDFLGSGVDFPVGNVSFFLFYSGHVAGSMIASLDMRRMQRLRLAMLFDILNILQSIRLLGTRGHYTIDLAVGVGAGILFDSLAGKYEEMMSKRHNLANGFSLISKDSLVN